MAIRNVITGGYGAGASIAFVVTGGYSIGIAADIPVITVSATFTSPETVSARFREPLGPHLLLEDGSGVLLLEDGSKLLLEFDPTDDFVMATFVSSITIKGNF